MQESYDDKIKRITREVLIQGYRQSGKKRVTTGMRIESLLRKEFLEESNSMANNKFDLTTPCCCPLIEIFTECPHYSKGNCEHADRRCKST